jgi:hypothetical protein
MHVSSGVVHLSTHEMLTDSFASRGGVLLVLVARGRGRGWRDALLVVLLLFLLLQEALQVHVPFLRRPCNTLATLCILGLNCALQAQVLKCRISAQ